MRSWLYDEHARALLDDIQTIEGLDVMCLLVRDVARAWKTEDIAAELGLDAIAVGDTVRHLVRRGLVRRHQGRVAPLLTGRTRQTMSSISRLCRDERADVLGAIAKLSIERVRATAARTLVSHPHPQRDPDESDVA